MEAAKANRPAASASPFGVLTKSATTITGTAMIRSSVRTFGRLTGNICAQYAPARAAACANTASSMRSVSFPVKVFCCEGW